MFLWEVQRCDGDLSNLVREIRMAQAKSGDRVKVHYTGKLESGDVFDSSREREPLEFALGSGGVIPGFENGVIGMEVGQTRSVTIPPDEAYGPVREELVATFERGQFANDMNPEVGQRLRLQQPDGRNVDVVVKEVNDDTVVLDANHPLAGETLIFEIELVEIAA